MIRFEMPKRECCATTLQPDPQGQWVLYTDGVKAIADAERRVWMEAVRMTREMADLNRHVGRYDKAAGLYAMVDEFDIRQRSTQAQADKEG